MSLSGIKQLNVPLPNNPLRSINCYLILPEPEVQEGRALLIDTGFKHPETQAALFDQLAQYNIDLKKLDVLATHLHSDHSGLMAELCHGENKAYASVIDGPLINAMTTEDYWKRFQTLYTLLDLDQDGISYLEHPGYIFCPKQPIDFTYLKDGDQLKYGKYTFEILEVPGHTPGQIVLVEKSVGLVISGDHILNEITPNISFWGFEHGDALGLYKDSLMKIKAMELQWAYPAHRSLIHPVNQRIDALVQHHDERLAEVLAILEKQSEPVTARTVATYMDWSVRQKDFNLFPSPQKWFATSEAMAHLHHLKEKGWVDMVSKNGILYFETSPSFPKNQEINL